MLQDGSEPAAGMARIVHGDFFGCSGGDDLAPAVATLGSEIDDPVAALDHFEVVFDDHKRVSCVGESLKHGQQLPDVVEVEPSGRFIEDVKGMSGRTAAEFAGEFDALCLAAGESRARLSELHVVEADVVDAGEHSVDLRMGLEEIDRLFDGEIEHVGDVASAIPHLERLAVVPAALASLAFHKDVGKEVHFDPADSLSLAGLATTALDVETESSRLVATDLRFGGHAKELADLVEDAGVRRRI